jgi:hypothetical protein
MVRRGSTVRVRQRASVLTSPLRKAKLSRAAAAGGPS